MKYKVKARISNHHLHLTKEAYDKLFDEEIKKRNDLNQVGEFAAEQTVNIKWNDREIKNVRLVGPLRSYNQVEISRSDARFLKVNPPVRKSGNLEDSLPIIIETPKASIEVKGLILANRHVHVNTKDAQKYGVKDNEKVTIEVEGDKGGTMEAYIKVSDNGFYELHIDTDDANAFLINDNDEVTMIYRG